MTTRKPCERGGCDRPSHAHGLCAVHYERERSRGRVRNDRVLPTRARNRATAALVEAHRAEFDELYADALAQVLEEQAQLVSLAEASGVEVTDDAQVFRLRRGPAGGDQDVTDRAILEPEEPACRACSTTHDRGHSCPECGTKLGLPVERGTSPKHVKGLAADLLKQRAAEAAAAEADWAWDNAKAGQR